MATKEEKKNKLRQEIIDAAIVYSQQLSGKYFLYVYGSDFFEVSFPVDRFLHLTGVTSRLSANQFYENAKNSTLSSQQFGFDTNHIYANAKRKIPCLIRLPELTNTMVCVLKDLHTTSLIYKLSVTNLEFTLGLTENIDSNNNKIDNYFLPRTLRVKDSSVERSKDGEIIDFVFAKDASKSKYDGILVADARKNIPDCISCMIEENIFKIYNKSIK